MQTPDRKQKQRTVERRLQWRDTCKSYVRGVGWGNKRGIGREWKRRLGKARRRYTKDLLAGRRGKEPIGLESTIGWRTW